MNHRRIRHRTTSFQLHGSKSEIFSLCWVKLLKANGTRREITEDNHLDAKEMPASSAAPGDRTTTRSSTQTRRRLLGRAAGKQEEYALNQMMKTQESRLKNMPFVPLQVPYPSLELGMSFR